MPAPKKWTAVKARELDAEARRLEQKAKRARAGAAALRGKAGTPDVLGAMRPTRRL